MKRLNVLLAGAFCALSLFAADLSGTWTGIVKLGNTGQELPFVVQMKQQGETITGRLDGIYGAPDVERVRDIKVEVKRREPPSRTQSGH